MASSYIQRRVREFHQLEGQQDPESPIDPTWETRLKRAHIDAEEFAELLVALVGRETARQLFLEKLDRVVRKRGHSGQGGLVEIIDGGIDSYVVVAGTLLECGVEDMPFIDEVCDSNDRKVGGGKDENGKFRKPEGWQPPDIEGILKSRGWQP